MTAFQKRLLDWFAARGRHALPWRATRDPYCILVSEFMLQQTQVDRVVPKYEAFVARFPDFGTLAQASTADVLREWKGLGYNSRAIRLQRIARIVSQELDGKMPREPAQLRALPGIGAYTAGAVRVFAFEANDVAMDTNIRRVVHRILHGVEFPARRSASQIEEEAREMLPQGRAYLWNSALMDLGATICTARAPGCGICPAAPDCKAAPVEAAALERLRALHAKKRSPQESIPFEQTTRFARGRIVDRLRELPPGSRISFLDLHRELGAILPPHTLGGIEKTLQALERDGIVRRDGESFALSD